MTEEMQKQLLSRLDTLAAKLGVAAQYVYALYVKQAKINGYEALLSLVFSIAVAIAAPFLIRWADSKYNAARYSEQDTYGFVFFVGWCLLLSAIVVSVFSATFAIDDLANPQYQAFHRILSDVN